MKIDQRTDSDCLRCCVAMVRGLLYEDVPDFVAEHPKRWLRMLAEWAKPHGVARIQATGDGELLHSPSIDGVRWIASGPTVRGTNHAVVYDGPRVYHDPHASRAGLLAITAATFFVPCGEER